MNVIRPYCHDVRAVPRRQRRGARPLTIRQTAGLSHSIRCASSCHYNTSAIRGLPRPRRMLRSCAATRDPIGILRERLGVTDEEFAEVDAEVSEIVERRSIFAKTSRSGARRRAQ